MACYGAAMFVAYVAESGQRKRTETNSTYFVQSAVIFDEQRTAAANKLVEAMRKHTGRAGDQHLRWSNLRRPGEREVVSELLGAARFLRIVSVVASKPLMDFQQGADNPFLYTFASLLQMLGRFGRAHEAPVRYVISHVRRFPTANLRFFEDLLRTNQKELEAEEPKLARRQAHLRARRHLPDPREELRWVQLQLGRVHRSLCKHRIDWAFIDGPGRIDQPRRIAPLQLAGLAASAIAAAFEPDARGKVRRRYLNRIAPRLDRGPLQEVQGYGLALRPWNQAAREQHPWVARL